MVIRRYIPEAALLPAVRLLVTESDSEFTRIHDALSHEIKPRGIIERMYVQETAFLLWEILRLRRCKAAIINSEFRAALENLLTRLLREPGADPITIDDEAGELARAWFTDPAAKGRVRELLSRSQLDESAIEAEAIRRSASELEPLDRTLASLESRRNKALRCIAEYRSGLAQLLLENTERIIGNKVLALEDASKKRRPPPAA